MCGALDCKSCHPENFTNDGRFIDDEEFKKEEDSECLTDF
jgi:hypothetical protein